MPTARFRRESELYVHLKQHFERQGYRVYAEVPAPHGGYIDLLAVHHERTVAVEMKLCFSRLALRQAARNRPCVWQSFVAVEGPVKVPGRARRMFTRRRVGLLLVDEGGITCALACPEAAPAFTVRQAFGSHLQGATAGLYASAAGGVPTTERVSAYRVLVARVEAVIRAHGGVAAAEQILEETLAWNYYRARRAGLSALLVNHFRPLAPDLWSTTERCRPAVHAVRLDHVVRAHDRSLRVILAGAGVHPGVPDAQPGDVLWFLEKGLIRARALVKFAGCYRVKQTPQRELRAGPAIFFPWRLRDPVPEQVIVAGLSGYRELAFPKRFPRDLPQPWQTLRPHRRRPPARPRLVELAGPRPPSA